MSAAMSLRHRPIHPPSSRTIMIRRKSTYQPWLTSTKETKLSLAPLPILPSGAHGHDVCLNIIEGSPQNTRLTQQSKGVSHRIKFAIAVRVYNNTIAMLPFSKNLNQPILRPFIAPTHYPHHRNPSPFPWYHAQPASALHSALHHHCSPS